MHEAKQTQKENEQWISRIHDMVLREYPFLQNVNLSVLFLDPAEQETDIGGLRRFTKDSEEEFVEVDVGSESHFIKAKGKRPVSVDMIARLCGIPPEQMTSELFNTFILLHEFGHAHDFAKNYRDDEALSNLQESQLADIWRNEYQQQKANLPVPGLAPSELVEQFKTTPLDTFLSSRPKTRERLADAHLTTQQEIIVAQDRAYREIPAEKYADEFAATFIKKHLPEILRDVEKTGS